jgi:thiol-disulfide isomerase/thioredoxin
MKQYSLMFALTIIAGCFSAEPQKTGKEGKPMPEFKLLLTDSITTVNIAEQSVNRPSVLFYYSPFCPHCKAQTKKIIEDIDELKDIQIYFISEFPISSLNKYNKVFQLSKYPNIITGMDVSKSVADYFEIMAMPYLAIYNKEKILNKCFLGKVSISQIKKIAEE